MAYLKPLRSWFETLNSWDAGLPEQALLNTIRLARGDGHIAILLIEPSNDADFVSFENVQNSPTIREVHRLIRRHWAVDPATVHILDI